MLNKGRCTVCDICFRYDEIHAFISSSGTEEEIQTFMAKNLDEIMTPTIHLQSDYLPKLPNGKFDKNEMMRRILWKIHS